MLPIVFEVLHRLKMAVKSRMLSVEELDLIEFLVAQVASLSSSLTCKVATVESSTPPPLAREAVFLQPDPVVPSVTPPPSPPPLSQRSGMCWLASLGR
jgi:hypothetical protein